jgi:hypothetical protein
VAERDEGAATQRGIMRGHPHNTATTNNNNGDSSSNNKQRKAEEKKSWTIATIRVGTVRTD